MMVTSHPIINAPLNVASTFAVMVIHGKVLSSAMMGMKTIPMRVMVPVA
jgi:hypothetical protein